MDKLIKLLKDISDNIEYLTCAGDENFFSTQTEIYLKTFEEIYKDGFRHSYFELSKFLEQLTPDVQSILPTILLLILQYTEQNDYWNESQTQKSIVKLCDHIQLEVLRLDRIENIKNISSKSQSLNNEAKEIAESANEASKEAENRIKDVTGQIIAVIGIFSGIVISFSISSTTFASALSNINKENFWYIVFLIDLFSIAFFNLIFMLLFGVSKLSGRSISIGNDKGLYYDKSTFKKFYYRYPYYFWTNIILVILLILLCIPIYLTS